ncbi:MAG: class I SAM-dependent DNA methyltransferase, partial [Firmicutes bacterium]|nr:class I SAM-dependent DNA methyltransferase [Bacillota bacterium]
LLIEQKSRGEDLQKAYQQAHSYLGGLADDELPDYILVCDFQNFHLYNRKRDNDCHKFTLAELLQNLHLFNFMTDKKFQLPLNESGCFTR